jgi:hypothetical protein
MAEDGHNKLPQYGAPNENGHRGRVERSRYVNFDKDRRQGCLFGLQRLIYHANDFVLYNKGVSQNHSFDVLFSTGLSEGGELLSKWV